MGGDEPPALPGCTLLEGALGQEATFDEESFEQPARQLYVATECQVLLHHVGEALLRLVLGHLGHPPCPWIEMAAMTSARDFKSWAEKQIVETPSARLRGIISPIVIGVSDHDAASDPIASNLLGNTVEFLRAFGARFLSDGPLYNSAKHGLTINGSSNSVKLHFPRGNVREQDHLEALAQLEQSFSFDGVNVECLERGRRSRPWYRVTRFIEIDHDLAMVYGGVKLISNIWAVALARYGDADSVELDPIDFNPSSIIERTGPVFGELRVPIHAKPLDDEATAMLLAEMEEAGRAEPDQVDEP